jgi:hypothetical protein
MNKQTATPTLIDAITAFERAEKARSDAYDNFINNSIIKVNEAINAEILLGNTQTTVNVEYPNIKSFGLMNDNIIDTLYNLFGINGYSVDINVVMRKGNRCMQIYLNWNVEEPR